MVLGHTEEEGCWLIIYTVMCVMFVLLHVECQTERGEDRLLEGGRWSQLTSMAHRLFFQPFHKHKHKWSRVWCTMLARHCLNAQGQCNGGG